MKKVTEILFLAIMLLFVMAGCDEANKIDYIKPVEITFDSVGSDNIALVDTNVMYYKAKISITSTRNIRTFRLFEIDTKTGARGKQITNDTAFLFVRNDTIINLPNDSVFITINDTIVQYGIDTVFNPAVKSYSAQFIVTKLKANKGIEVVVEDEDLTSYSKKLIVKITPKVVTSNVVIIETAEVYKGPYYASWLGGRAYFRHNGATYKNEIDFSLGDIYLQDSIIIVKKDTIVSSNKKDTVFINADTIPQPIPHFISSDIRQENGFLSLSGLRSCKFALTTLTASNFSAISPIDPSVINNMVSPTSPTMILSPGKVYLYENNTERGLIYVASKVSKKAYLEQPDGTWIKTKDRFRPIINKTRTAVTWELIPNYYEIKIQTKTVPKN